MAMTQPAGPRAGRALRVVVVAAFGGLLIWGGMTARSGKRFAAASGEGDPCGVVLAPHEGSSPLDVRIREVQERLRKGGIREAWVETLGWLFVEKARGAGGGEFYRLAERTADCLLHRNPTSAAAKLLRGHALHNAHRFREAEKIAAELVRERASPYDYGLLGDALMEQGRLEEAAEAYQKMADLRPGMQSYARASHLRWLHGDMPGAVALMRLAAQAAPRRDPQSAAWCFTRLALYLLQSGDAESAARLVRAALELQPGYPAAIFAEARVELARQRIPAALAASVRAVELDARAEHLWLYADLLRTAGRTGEARRVEDRLMQDGIREDPRTVALFLATRGDRPDLAVEIATLELKSRQDIFTYDAWAWALHAAGRAEEAWPLMEQALAAGTRDARVFLHAGLISRSAGRTRDAEAWFRRSRAARWTLFPSERNLLPGLETRPAPGS